MISDKAVHEIHASEIRAFLECRRQWDLQYTQRWQPIKTPKPLAFGRAWHIALEELYRPEYWHQSKSELYHRALLAFEHEIDRQKVAYLERIEAYALDPEDAADYEERWRLGKNMLANLVRSLDKDKYRPIAVEEEFEAPIRDMTCNCNRCLSKIEPAEHGSQHGSGIDYGTPYEGSLPIYLRCRFDAIFEDRTGSHWIVDHKSAAQLLDREAIDQLHRDPQMGPYVWIAYQNGLGVCGIIYNQFRKDYPKPPKALKVPQQGRRYSTSQLQLTDYYTAKRVFKTDAYAYRRGAYDGYLEWLKTVGKKDFFREFKISKTEEQIREIGLLLSVYAAEMLNDTQIYPNPSVPHVCKRCSFGPPCLSMYGGHHNTEIREELEASYIQEPLLWYERERLERRTP
jgi:hypothetical protein